MPSNNKNLLLTMEGVSHHFRNEDGKLIEALQHVSFSVREGEFLTIVGPSGSGKSTLLRLALNLEKPSKGKIVRNYKKAAMVFQNFAIFPWLSVAENIAFGLRMKGLPQTERDNIVGEKIKEVGLVGFENSYPKELSGGMRQRVGIARALALSPDILFMDEPFSSLDTITARKLKDDIAALWQKYQMTVVMVTHLIEEAVELGDRIIVISQHPGTIKCTEEVNLPRPRDRRSKEFFALVDLIDAKIEK